MNDKIDMVNHQNHYKGSKGIEYLRKAEWYLKRLINMVDEVK